MMCASRLAERRGLIPSDVTQRQERLLAAFGLPTAPQPWPIDELVKAMHSDKKALAGKLRFVLPRRLGEVTLIEEIPESDVRLTLEEMVK
jgi:3-dehydroquinate synthetase